ncbi:MAG: protein phosphatase CheZ [Rhodospirillales bacterium]|nr:protein phosphatase CheZ [Rhodospirillales bacterium]MCB9965290.1 protein phosphatase CheZ [Rhodospirillales bacterium]MCB9972941.1 protein phosphatase CheZ [Rhodospirillales bacterium]MCB9980121.1 protein phosphatase CheZ [Rhodospirillales bacterium]
MSEHHDAFGRDKVVKIISSVIQQVEKGNDISRERIAADLLDLTKVIDDARREIAMMRPAPLDGEEPTAQDELDAVVEETAGATGTIMDKCDVIQSALPDLEGKGKELVEEAVIGIYEACSFQDITGQRIRKVVKAFKQIDEKIEALVAIMGHGRVAKQESRSADELLLNGPQMGDKAMSQDDIDKLLDSFD